MSSTFRDDLASIPEQLGHPLRLVGHPLDEGGRLLVGGVGGSAAAGDFLELLLMETRPTRVLREADLPADIREDDELLVVSYSGETRESLELWRESAELGLGRAAVASGGSLLALARAEHRPWVAVPDGLAPRTALGALLRAVALLAGGDGADWTAAAAHLKGIREDARLPSGLAGDMAGKLQAGTPVVISGDAEGHAAARRWAAALAENAKVPVALWMLPEAAHNQVMAVGRDAPRRAGLVPVGVGRPRDDASRRRWDALLGILADHGSPPLQVDIPHSEPWIRSLGLAYFGDWMSVHLAEALGVDPGPIELLNEVKRRLASGKESAS